MASKSTLRVETFKALGIELEHEGNQQVGYCPKCGKRKLYVDPETTQFNCKVCQYSGNATTAVRDCVEEWKKNKHKKATLDRLVKMLSTFHLLIFQTPGSAARFISQRVTGIFLLQG